MAEDRAREVQRDDEANRTEPAVGRWAARGGVAAVLVCCLGHGLLLAFGAAGFAATVGGAVGGSVVVIGALLVLAAAGVLLAARLRNRKHARPGTERP